jgi:cell division protein FtsW (lipid II flippase)
VLSLVLVLAILSAPIVWAYGLEDYQRTRVVTFLDPEQDPRGAGYQQIQARITVGSGGLTGRGFLQGTQNQYDFVPAAHTDFIFAVAGEEFGVIACIVIIALFGFIVFRGFARIMRGGDLFTLVAVAGLLAQFGFQALINMGVAIRLLPAKGMTLPFLSYGGSSTIATAVGLGMVLALTRERRNAEGFGS